MTEPRPQLPIGPLVLRFEPDGDDPGVGIVVMEFKSGYRGATSSGVTVDEWNAAWESCWP